MSKLTVVASVNILTDKAAETKAEVSRISQWVNLIRENPNDDVTAFLRAPKGKTAREHPVVIAMSSDSKAADGTIIPAPMSVDTAIVRWSEATTIARAYLNGAPFTDTEGKVKAIGWKAALKLSRDFAKGRREQTAQNKAEQERAALIGKLTLSMRGQNPDAIIAAADEQIAKAESTADADARYRRASKAANDAGCFILHKGSPTSIGQELLSLMGKADAEKLADAILTKLLESDKAKPEAFTAPEPAKTHTGEAAKAA